MELTNEFRVDADPATAWAVLTDLERIAPCMPGAQLNEVVGDVYQGTVKVKVGPISAQYKGSASVVERDEVNRRVVVKADGKDTRGQGKASAVVTAALSPDGSGTKVSVGTELTISGKVAQFGRGVLADVSAKLLEQFVESLESTVLAPPSDAAAAVAGSPPVETPTAPGVVRPEPAPIDLLGAAGAPLAKRVVPVAAVIGLIWLLSVLFRRQRHEHP